MNEQNQTAAPKTFTTIDGNSLMAQEYEPLHFSIEIILPHGIFVFAGSPKVGKSWLTLDMCRAISTGGKLWGFTAAQGDVLYLALEDKYNRLQGRLMLLGLASKPSINMKIIALSRILPL